MAHKEVGFQQVQKFITTVTPYGHPDAAAKLIGRGINVMLSPLPRNKRAKNPRQAERDAELAAERAEAERAEKNSGEGKPKRQKQEKVNAPDEEAASDHDAQAEMDPQLEQS